MDIRPADLDDPRLHALLGEHLRDMAGHSPPESIHALDLGGLRHPDIRAWTAWDGGTLLACGALKALDATHGEVKSMRTAQDHRRRGAGASMLAHIIAEARARGLRRLSLETGTAAAFAPAHALYARFGFEPCGPFGDYRPDPYSCFMTLALAEDHTVAA